MRERNRCKTRGDRSDVANDALPASRRTTHDSASGIGTERERALFAAHWILRNMQGRLEILAVSVHAEGDTSMDHYDEHDDMALQTNKPLLPIETETDPAVIY
ncbi:hypothetical protein F2Q70_00033668 [Brassica cretica]|uniref:Uncharacterized protein n=1 Tax=Brassica cretica TaxID=69181 RepID=A0A8S9JRG5_BRACR|nr:hypothetical protein F2Q68_00028528 [Brassica cretica]KAF2584745.1 hypothetical protein F2Q70_00033668 [Brassica cretica]